MPCGPKVQWRPAVAPAQPIDHGRGDAPCFGPGQTAVTREERRSTTAARIAVGRLLRVETLPPFLPGRASSKLAQPPIRALKRPGSAYLQTLPAIPLLLLARKNALLMDLTIATGSFDRHRWK